MASRKGKRGEKVSKTPETSTIEEQQKEKEIVPGKGIYEKQWLKILERDTMSCFIRAIVEEVFEASYAEGYYITCERQSYSDAVHWSKLLMLRTVECYFLTSDTELCQSVWVEDVEPDSVTIDSWARGVIPLEEAIHVIAAVTDSKADTTTSERGTVEHSSNLAVQHVNECENIISTISPHVAEVPFKKQAQCQHSRPMASKKRKNTPIAMKVLDQAVSEDHAVRSEPLLTESYVSTLRSHTPPSPSLRLAITPNITSVLDNLPRPPKQTDTVVNQSGKVIYTRKLDAQKFPFQSIKTQIRVSQAPVTAMNSHQLLVAEQTSHNKFHLPHNHRICLNKRNILPVSHSSSSEVGRIMRVDSNRHPKQPSLPPLVDIIDPLPGVTVKEDGRTILGYGSPNFQMRSPRKYLKPITPLKDDLNVTKVASEIINHLKT